MHSHTHTRDRHTKLSRYRHTKLIAGTGTQGTGTHKTHTMHSHMHTRNRHTKLSRYRHTRRTHAHTHTCAHM